MLKKQLLAVCLLFLAIIAVGQSKRSAAILKAEDYKHYVDYFNKMEDENIVQAIPNAEAWQWMKTNIPLFECPQQNFEELFYYRWWTLRKHIKQTPVGYVFTEFLVKRNYADKYNLISSALGHHIYEGRWLHDQKYLDDYIKVWYRGNDGKPMGKLNAYSSWTIDAIYNRFMVNHNTAYLKNLLPDLETDYAAWETAKRRPDGLFWQYDVRDAMEETISGGRREKNARPSINSYMYGNARALSSIEQMAGNANAATRYGARADTIRKLLQDRLWNSRDNFFETLKETGKSAEVREEIGFIPWYFNLPDKGYEIAWKALSDSSLFSAPFGITTAQRNHPAFRTHGCCECEWDGPVWPFATSQTLTALANVLNNYRQSFVTGQEYFRQLELYTESQYYRGRPYIGEYLDEKTGYWLKGDQERSRYYNHSTFNDLVITGLIGLRPRADDIIEINPLIPENKWGWFCLDNISYHGKILTIIWDKDGTRYKRGKGLALWVNGKKAASSSKIEKITYKGN